MDKFLISDRSQIPDEFKWKLTDLYPNDSDWEKDIAAVKNSLPDLQKQEGLLTKTATNLWTALDLRSKIEQLTGKLFAYAKMHRDGDAANTKYQAMTGKVQSLIAEASSSYAFIDPEILTLSDTQLETFLSQDSRLEDYRFYLENLLLQRKHILSPKEEALLSRLSEVTQASAETFQMLARADIEFPDIIDEAGKQLPLSEGRYHSFIISPDRTTRQQAFEKLFGTYKKYRNTFAATLNGNIKQDIFYAKTRGYPSQLAASLEPDQIPLTLYDQLIETVEKHLPTLHRYVKLKQQALKLPDIHMYDIYTPLVSNVALEYSYQDAVKLVKTALLPLGKEYLSTLAKGLDSSWVDVYENKGKQTGAYSWGVYGVHPFVLLNFNGRYSDVSTLAHELGHALHSFYSHKTQPYPTSSYTIFCAEVASTTNEILLMDHMLATTKDRQIELYLLNQYLESIRTTVYRQTMFAEFEKSVYSLAESGETLTATQFEDLWHRLNTKYYGPALIKDEASNSEWARIPHFYRSFYVYKYATGYSAATALASQLISEGMKAQTRYLSFLRSGGSDYSLPLLKQAGVDMSQSAPVDQTLTKFAKLLDQLESKL